MKDERILDRKYCLGKECPDKRCEICPAERHVGGILDSTDTYRQSIKKGYYTSSVVEVMDPKTGQKRYVYTKSGE